MIQNNPWASIPPGSEKLVDTNLKFEIAWGVERTGEYALYIPLSSISIVPQIEIKHLSVVLYKALDPDSFIWVILLKNKEQWSIFKKLCEDLCSVSTNALNEKQLVSLISNRLNNWQNLFARKAGKLSLEKQMGLYGELYFLDKIIISEIGVEAGINSWVGSEYDKQDFLLSDKAIEVKSYRASKGEIVTISSKEQLYTVKEELYLVTVALTNDESGETIKDKIDEINNKIAQSDNAFLLYEEFQEKILSFGYFDEFSDELNSFIVDDLNAYRVSGDFPRILPNEVRSGVINLKYQVDLAAFANYKISINNLKL